MQTPEFQNAMREWEPRLNVLGSTSRERLERMLDLSIPEMTAYSDPMIQRDCMDPKYLSREEAIMDGILSSLDLLIGGAESYQVPSVERLARYAWLHEYSMNQIFKMKARRTIDRLILLSKRYLHRPSSLSYQSPNPDASIEQRTTKGDSARNEQKSAPLSDCAPTQLIRIDLDQIRQSVYDLIDRYPEKVLFLEYLTAANIVDNMSPALYKSQFEYYKTEHPYHKTYTKIIEHKNYQYNFKIDTFQSHQQDYPGPEILASAFGYAISGMNLVTIWRKR